MEGFSSSMYRWLTAAFSLAFLPYLSESHQNQAPFGQGQGQPEQQVPQSPYDSWEFDFDSLPGSQHEFKVEVAAGRQDCFHQMIKGGASIHVSFEVLKGADRNVDVYLAAPNGEPIDRHQWTSQGYSDSKAMMDGIYTVCIDNTFSRFTPKLVYLFWVAYVPEDWEMYADEITKFDDSVGNVTESLKLVTDNVHKMKNQQASSRQRMVMDYYVVKSNDSFIQNLSLVMIALIMGTSCVQVVFVRRLFRVPNVTPTSKPRA